MFDFISKYLGHWIWYDIPHSCQYEQLRFSVYGLNLVMIVALICVLMWGLRRQFRDGITERAWPIIRWLGVGLLCWAFQYVLSLSNFHFQSNENCGFSGPPQGLFVKYGVPLCSAIVAIAFFVAGSYLLQLESRFHTALSGPTEDGIRLEGFSRILGNSRVRIVFALFGVIIIGFQWRAAHLAAPPSAPIAIAARWLDAWGNCFAHLAFGLGMLREMNRERRDFVGMASACSMLFYGLVQLTALKGDDVLFFDGYILAALLKFALVLTMFSFGAMIKQMIRARDDERDDERREFTDLLIALGSALQHEFKPLKSLNLGVAGLAAAIPEMSKDLLDPIREAVADAQDFFSGWSERLKPQQVSLSRSLRERRFVVKQENENDLYEVWVPPIFLQWAVDRLRENGRNAGATEIIITLSRGNENKPPVVIAVISNDGKPIPTDAKLFEKPHGTWVARYLMQLAGGALEWKSSDSRAGVFRIQLPVRTSAPIGTAAAAAMRS